MEFSTCGAAASVQISESLMSDVLKACYETGKIPCVLRNEIGNVKVEIYMGCPTLKFNGGCLNQLTVLYSFRITILIDVSADGLDVPNERITCDCRLPVQIVLEKSKYEGNDYLVFVLQFDEDKMNPLENISFSTNKYFNGMKDEIGVLIKKSLLALSYTIPVSPFIEYNGYYCTFFPTISPTGIYHATKLPNYLSVFIKSRSSQDMPAIPSHPQQLWVNTSDVRSVNCAASVTKEMFFENIDEILQLAGIEVNTPLPGCENMNKKVTKILFVTITLRKLILINGPYFEFNDGYIRLTMKVKADLSHSPDITVGVDAKLKLRFESNNVLCFDIVECNISVGGILGGILSTLLAFITLGLSKILESVLKKLISSEIQKEIPQSFKLENLAKTFLFEKLGLYISTDQYALSKNIATLKILGKSVDIYSVGVIVRTHVSMDYKSVELEKPPTV